MSKAIEWIDWNCHASNNNKATIKSICNILLLLFYRRVEREIVNILEKKLSQCRGDANSLIAGGGVAYPADVFCKKEAEDYRRARLNFEIKCKYLYIVCLR